MNGATARFRPGVGRGPGRRRQAPTSGLVVATTLVVWEIATRRVDSMFFPPPSVIAARLRHQWFSGPAAHLFLSDHAVAHLLPSLSRVAVGWSLASAAGVAIGLALGRSPRLSACAGPVLHFTRSVPVPLLVPVFIVLLPIGTPMQLGTIAFGAVWPVLLSTADGTRSVDPAWLDVAGVFGVTGRRRLRSVILPAAAPAIFAGLHVGLSIAVVLMVVSEFVASTNGVGFALVGAQRSFDLPGMWAAMVLVGLLGWSLNGVLSAVERPLLAWSGDGRDKP